LFAVPPAAPFVGASDVGQGSHWPEIGNQARNRTWDQWTDRATWPGVWTLDLQKTSRARGAQKDIPIAHEEYRSRTKNTDRARGNRSRTNNTDRARIVHE